MAFANSNESGGDGTPTTEIPEPYAYEKHLESNVLRNAIGSGYLNSLTVEELLVRSQKNNRDEKSIPKDRENIESNEKETSTLEDIYLLFLKSSRIRNIKLIGFCENLTVCNLSCNYVEKFDSLKNCKQLRKLDLHHNQIVELPNEDFWGGMTNLEILYLHDNGISTFNEVKKLALSENLAILTMYDTPVSLKDHYRHFIANSIWSLKALDQAVLSDEEIIEDAKFTERFQSLKPQFFFKPQSLESQELWTFEHEIKAIQKDLSAINRIQAKFCPVLIIQRFTRGWLTRLRYRFEKEKRLWAAVTIQRHYRNYCGIELPKNAEFMDNFSYFSISSQRLDYDTYINHKRSRDRSLASTTALQSILHGNSSGDHGEHGVYKVNQRTVKLFINLKELEASTSKILAESSTFEESVSQKLKEQKSRVERKSKHVTRKEDGFIDIATLSKFVGLNLIEPDKQNKVQSTKRNKQREKVEKTDEFDHGLINGKIPFRLEGLRAPEMKCELIEELTRNLIDGADDIRQTRKEIDEKLAMIPKPRVYRNYPMTTDQKIFIRTHGTMSLSCFRAVDQAYKDRDRAKNLSAKQQHVEMKKQRRDAILKLREHAKYVFVGNIQAERNEAKKELAQKMDDLKSEVSAKQEHVAAEKSKKERRKQERNRARAFAVEFCCQNNAISKALAVNAENGAKNKIIETNREKSRNIKEDIDRQKEIIKRYNEHRNLMLQSEVSLGKSKLESDLKQRSVRDRKEARLRVRKLRKVDEKKKIVLPSITTAPPKLPPLAVVAETQMKTWETLPKKEFKFREHDRINIGS